MLIAYRGEELVSSAVLESGAALNQAVARARLASGLERADPGIRVRLLVQDWAD